MTAGVLVPVEEYIATSYSPDVDYDEGRIVERNVGQRKHARLQYLIVHYMCARESEWGITGFVEQRIRVAPNKFCVADVCAVRNDRPDEEILEAPPLFTIEILSDGDSFSEVEKKAREYLDLGVPYVWTIDPETGRCFRHTPEALLILADGVLRIEHSPIAIPISDLLSQSRTTPKS
ncbi:MAG: Uma2 family endonuclease [Acidobacteriota bacterium]|nr:Uma2 family endonuclease [Acidobacteriota bacterium]